jgi:hypothetical protein
MTAYAPTAARRTTRGEEAFLQCACPDKKWHGVAGVEGTPQESEFLREHGFQFTGDVRDQYYLGSMNRLIWLYADGSWAANPRPKEGMTFEKYVRASTLEEFLAV